MNFSQWMVAGIVLLSASISQATITPVRFYHLGEGDAGLGHAVAATNSLDSVSANDLVLTGAPKYWNHAAPGNTNSTFSLLFSTTNQGTAAVVTNTTNVCLEAWANTGWRSTHVVTYNGNPALDGYGLVLETNVYKAVLGGVGTVGTVPCPPGQWMHLALVCSNGTAKFFTNGVLAAAINATPNPPTGNLTVGGPNTGTNDVQGFVDEVRISKFSTGEFSAADLLYVPPLGNMVVTHVAPDKIVVSVPSIYSSVTLQESTNLATTNWQSLAAPALVGNQQVWTNSIQGTARFYRLTKPVGDKPVPVITMEQDGKTPLDFNGPYVNEGADGRPNYAQRDVSAGAPLTFDASASLDPFSDSSNTLSFHWEIFKADYYSGAQYTSYGVTGYHAPVLRFAENSLSDQEEEPGSDENMAYWRVRFTLRHIPYTPGVVPAQETIIWFRFKYLFSALSLSESALCQSCPPPPASCSGCTIEAGRATAEAP